MAIKQDAEQAMLARLAMLDEALTSVRAALTNDDPLQLKMAIRDAGWLIFALDQQRQRLPVEGEPHVQ